MFDSLCLSMCACFLFSSSSYMPCRHQCSTKNTHMHILSTQYWQKFFVKSVLVCLTQPLALCQRRRRQLAICMWAHKEENGKNVAFSDVCECASVWYGGSCLFVSFGGRLNLPAPTTATQKQERLKCKQSTDISHLLLPPHRLINMYVLLLLCFSPPKMCQSVGRFCWGWKCRKNKQKQQFYNSDRLRCRRRRRLHRLLLLLLKFCGFFGETFLLSCMLVVAREEWVVVVVQFRCWCFTFNL